MVNYFTQWWKKTGSYRNSVGKRRVTFKRHKPMKSNLHRIGSTGPIKPWRLYLLLASVQKAEGEGGDLGVCSGFYTIERSQSTLIFIGSRLCVHWKQSSWLIHRPELVSLSWNLSHITSHQILPITWQRSLDSSHWYYCSSKIYYIET